ncbi:hypothetical protein KLMA_20570 [Kluyveromyces marxianus]|uniref:Uncharacterized protein n=1 Tax=Kluyveromyces marxianus TaxID=4911 RepID=A0ABX6ESP0_KLUMA|nr:hypothetical protein FIM1_1427 [Kluyveromyces marxianus]BAP70554.1 hypothetical protein KLMA_20570 [Kluyveromyces marxianus]
MAIAIEPDGIPSHPIPSHPTSNAIALAHCNPHNTVRYPTPKIHTANRTLYRASKAHGAPCTLRNHLRGRTGHVDTITITIYMLYTLYTHDASCVSCLGTTTTTAFRCESAYIVGEGSVEGAVGGLCSRGKRVCVYGEGVVQGCGKSKGGREIRGGGWDGEGCVAGGKEGEFSRVAKRDGLLWRGYPGEGRGLSLSLSLFLPGRGRVIQ